jgi:2-polyprenyl-3-methyl-5-hydroxy-6-metoxy-1,4-benzoquinol methylase
MAIETNEEYFSALARRRGVNAEANADKFTEIGKLLLPASGHDNVLECGGGAGFYTLKLLNQGYKVTCIDVSEEALAVNMQNATSAGRASQLETIAADFNSFCNSIHKEFDQILFIKVLHHFENLVSVERAIHLAIRRCRIGGRIVVFEPNGDNLAWKLFLSLKRDAVTKKRKWLTERNMRFTTRRRFLDILNKIDREYGECIKYKVKYHYVIPATILNRLGQTLQVLHAGNSILERSCLSRRFAFNISLTIDVLR